MSNQNERAGNNPAEYLNGKYLQQSGGGYLPLSANRRIQLQTRIRAVADDLENGMSSAEIVQLYAARWGLSEPTLRRYIALAKDIVMQQLHNTDAIIEAARGMVIAEEAEKSMRSTIELEAKLVSIIEAGLEVSKEVSGPGGSYQTKAKPTPNQVLKAIDILFRRRGAYKPQHNADVMEPVVIRVESEAQKELIQKMIPPPMKS